MRKKIRLHNDTNLNQSVLRTDRLRLLRKKIELNQEQLGKQLGLSNKTISNYECGDRQPDYENLLKLAKFFGVSVSYLLGETDNPKLQDDAKVLLTDKDLENMSPDAKETVLSIIDAIKTKHRLSMNDKDVESNEKTSRQK
ncbi:MAG TPA: helix-turn-helix transcriptional regulator [Syntrophomonadaceae bacterium]|nr:helix-turn-helix transcriptional regulator [Syntrophomonadaceae bacterium]